MASRELELLLKARNLTNEAFKAVETSLKGTEQQTKQTKSALDNLSTGFSDAVKGGIALGGGFAIGQKAGEALLGALTGLPSAMLGWSKSAIDAAGHMSDLSLKTGIGVEVLQKLRPLGSDVGLSMDEMAQSIFKMQKTMEVNPDLFAKFGISLKDIRGLKAEDQFLAIANAIAGMTDPATQAAASAQLLGDRGGDMIKIIRSGNLDLQDFGGLTAEQADHLDAMGDAIDRSKIALENMKLSLAAAFVASPANVQALESITEALRGLAILVREDGDKIVTGLKNIASFLTFGVSDLAGSVFKSITNDLRKLNQLQRETAELAAPGAMKAAADAKVQAEALRRQRAEQEAHRKENEQEAKKAAAEAKRRAEEAAKTEQRIDSMLYDSKLRAMKDWQKKSEEGEQFQRKMQAQSFAYEMKLIQEELSAARDRFQRRKEYEEAFAQIVVEAAQRQHEANIQATADFGDLGAAIADLGDAFGSGALSGLGNAMDLFAGISLQAQNAKTGMEKATVAIGAATAAFKSGSVLSGAAAGAAAGSMFGGIGALIGGAAGGILGFLGKDKKHVQEVNQLRDAFVQSAGGAAELKRKAAEAGVSLDAVFSARDSKNGVMGAIDAVKKGLGGWEESHAALADAVQRYGFTIDELGPKFKQQELDKQAAALLQDYQLLVASGIENATVLERMAPAMNEYVNTAIAAGTAIPENMRPALQKMSELGLLTDAAGNKLDNLDGLSFTESLTEGLRSAVDAIRELVAALGGVPHSVPPIHVPIIEDHSGGGGGGGGGEDPGFIDDGSNPLDQLARGGVVLPFMPRAANGFVAARAGGTPVVVGEGGDTELVAPVKALADRIGAAAAAAAGGAGQQINVYIDGELVAQAMGDRSARGGLKIKRSSVRR